MATREARPQTCLVCSKYVYQLRYIIRLSKVMEKNEKNTDNRRTVVLSLGLTMTAR